jgi:hypothetical protein
MPQTSRPIDISDWKGFDPLPIFDDTAILWEPYDICSKAYALAISYHVQELTAIIIVKNIPKVNTRNSTIRNFSGNRPGDNKSSCLVRRLSRPCLEDTVMRFTVLGNHSFQ